MKIFKELGKDIKKIRESYSSKATGVYLLVNRKTGGIYVGSSMKLRERINVYSRLDGTNGKIGERMKKWLRNHGVDAFSVVILSKVNTMLNKEEMREIESELISLYKERGYKMYNILRNTNLKMNKSFKQLTLRDKMKVLKSNNY